MFSRLKNIFLIVNKHKKKYKKQFSLRDNEIPLIIMNSMIEFFCAHCVVPGCDILLPFVDLTSLLVRH
jgi:hypothetical protein